MSVLTGLVAPCEPNMAKSGVRSQGKSPSKSVLRSPKSPDNAKTESRIQPLLASDESPISDCVVLILHCLNHNRVAIQTTKIRNKKYRWFPFALALPKSTWQRMVFAIAMVVLGATNPNTFSVISCLHHFRLQLPRNQKYITRLTYYGHVNNKLIDLCQSKGKAKDHVEWVSLAEINNNQVKNLWGPEVQHYMNVLDKKVSVKAALIEYSIQQAFSMFRIRDTPTNREEEMLRDSKVNEKDMERIYDDYIEHCYPCFYMTVTSFKCYMLKHGIEHDQSKLDNYFNAFRFMEKPYMSFHELLIGLVAIGKEAPHCETRLKIIFRFVLSHPQATHFSPSFYDNDLDGYLNRNELTNLARDLQQKQVPSKSLEESVAELIAAIRGLGSVRPDEPEVVLISFTAFYRAVKNKILVGTSKLCRANLWICASIARNLIARRIQKLFCNKFSFKQIVRSTRFGRCEKCVKQNRARPFRVAQTVLCLNEAHQFSAVAKLDFDKEKGHSHSLEVQFNSQSLPNIYMTLVRSFIPKKGTVQNFKGLFEVITADEKAKFIDDIETICELTRRLVESEPRFKDAISPAFIIGDIHGNVEDLLSLEKCLWPTVPFLHTQIVFLGDYVDRGRWGFECALYLFCLKLVSPERVVLLRGNHEVRSVQKTYSFEAELIIKYGRAFGKRMFEMVNEVFDCLPYGAIVDGCIFCCHGGISCEANRKEIRSLEPKLSHNVPRPENAGIIWEVLWSDPCEGKAFHEEYELLTGRLITDNLRMTEQEEAIRYLFNEGFVFNQRRGTAFLFNETALCTFLAVNRFSHVFRAHEVPKEGYRLNFNNRCVTIFSCSHYCGCENECAVILVYNNRIRIIQLDTFSNSPATEAA